jgi:predicted RNA-binding protein with PIN domain
VIAVTFLIDGYNLMHAAGLAHAAMPAAQFERARTRLLNWLADGVQGRAELLVVFDAQQAPAPSPESVHRGVRVRFAYRRTADDLIEELIAAEARPEALAMVSNDSRVREAGRRAACKQFSCEEFMDWLLATHGEEEQGVDTPRSPEDKPQPTSSDVDELLHVFSKPKKK